MPALPRFATTAGFRRGATLLLACALACSRLLAAPTSTATRTTTLTPIVRLNEVLATNTTIANGNTRPDIIELHNAGDTAANLAGMSLTDDPALPRKFVFPAGTTIPAGGYLVVYADSATTAPGLHTGFALDAEGDIVQLYPASGTSSPMDSIEFGFQAPDLSIARTGSAANIWALTAPTPGAANSAPLALAAPDALRINEWAGKITFRVDHDLIELFNPGTLPVALGGVRLTDNTNQPTRFVFPALSFLAARGFLPLYGADFQFGLDGDRETVTLLGENNEQIDQITLLRQPDDRSSGRSPDGAATVVDFTIPTPGLPNQTPLPAGYQALLDHLRITEVMYQPQAQSNASQFEFLELQNIGAAPLDLGGVRFTNGTDYTFPAGLTLAPGAFIVVVNDRSSFRSRYPQVPESALAPGAFNGSLANDGEVLALTLPAPWEVHILNFRFEPGWAPSTAGGGRSLVPIAPASTPPQDYRLATTWRASAADHGSPNAADPGTPGGGAGARLSNLSVRTSLPAAENLIVGFFVDGGPRNILVRAAGPALTALGVPGAMENPRLELYSGPTLVLSNDDWPAALAGVFPGVGAFAFPPGSRDAAFQQAISGAASVHARGSGAGIVLVEAYETGAGSTPRLTNLSARNRVGTGDDILIAGFNIAGTGSKPLLIRAVGPKLTEFGVAGVLRDPRLEVYDANGAKLLENDTWSPALASTFAAVGAFPLDAGSLDAALLTTLPPGAYTVQVRGADGGTGEALVEIYEAP